MSSFIAHAAVSVIIGRSRQASWFEIPILIGFCWTPDVDYLFPLLFDQHPTVRWTRSFAAVLVLWGVWPMGAKRPGAGSLAVAAAVFIPFVIWGISLTR